MDFSDVKKVFPERPVIQLAPLIDIVFLLLIFFMAAFIFYELETEINISVPTAEESTEMRRTAGEIIINVREDGTVVVNQKELGYDGLKSMLGRVSELYKGQPVIIRGDRDTRHKHIIKVLDICAASDIWNVSFATMKEKEE
ncbi:MAG: biopolymer transporter ExbD [Candidatus Omnitrophica bacterium]|nr:biopolymer transporter ExbD [Candidatus Omnitrophota bacterium]